MSELMRTANEGQILRRGIRTAIVGRPNAGKSSLLNQLLGHERAIVSHIAGTTRDTIEETANIRGLPVVFIDTAGLREARDEIEVEGIRRSRESLAKAELILHVFDASEPLTSADETYLAEFAAKKRILVRNKTDLPVKFNFARRINRAHRGRLLFERAGDGSVEGRHQKSGLAGKIEAGMLQVMINSRHQEALGRTREATVRTIDALRADESPRTGRAGFAHRVNAVGEIVGKTSRTTCSIPSSASFV